MMIHLFQFRFNVTHMFKLYPPSHLINFGTALDLSLNLFWIGWEICTTVEVRDIYRMEFEVFLSLGWVLSSTRLRSWSSARACASAGRKWCRRPAWTSPGYTRPRPSTSITS